MAAFIVFIGHKGFFGKLVVENSLPMPIVEQEKFPIFRKLPILTKDFLV